MVSLPVILLLTITMATTSLSWAEIIDLSHKFGPETFAPFGNAPYNRTIVFQGDYSPGVFVSIGNIEAGEHVGTHMDAPLHFGKDWKDVSELELENFILPGVMIDCSEEVDNDNVYIAPRKKLQDWEEENGRIPDGAGIVFNFNWSSRYGNPKDYVMSQDLGNSSTFRHPSISKEAAEWMVHERGAKLIAVDVVSPDFAPFPVHRVVLPLDTVVVENTRDPGRLPTKGFRLFAAPVAKIGASGTQIRFFAITMDDERMQGNGGLSTSLASVATITTSCFILLILKSVLNS